MQKLRAVPYSQRGLDFPLLVALLPLGLSARSIALLVVPLCRARMLLIDVDVGLSVAALNFRVHVHTEGRKFGRAPALAFRY